MGIRQVLRGSSGFGVCAAALAAFLALPGTVAMAQSSGSSAGDQTASQSTAAQTTATSTAQPNLAGTWKLNEKQSDDPREKIREAMQANGSEGGGEGMRAGRQGRRPGRGGGGMMAEFSRLTIEQSDKGVKVTGSSGRVIATSEPQSKDDQNAQDSAGGRMMRFPPAEAKWQGNQLVATSQGFGGGTTTRTFELSPDGKQLFVTTKIENQRFTQPVTYKLVYDPGKNGSNSQ
jgi:hypothetical protein